MINLQVEHDKTMNVKADFFRWWNMESSVKMISSFYYQFVVESSLDYKEEQEEEGADRRKKKNDWAPSSPNPTNE